jgi:hypothetical protein
MIRLAEPTDLVSLISAPEDENRPSFRTVAFFRILDDEQSPKTQYSLRQKVILLIHN